MTAPARAVDDAELLAALLHADPRPPRARLHDLATVHLDPTRPRYGRPEHDPLGTNRWDHPWAAWPWVKTAPDRWIHTGWTSAPPRRDLEVAGLLPSTTPRPVVRRPGGGPR